MNLCEWLVDGAIVWAFNAHDAKQIYALNTGRTARTVQRLNHEDAERYNYG